MIVLTEVNTGASQRITPSEDGRFDTAVAPGTYRVELQAETSSSLAVKILWCRPGATTQLRVAIEGPPNEENIEIDADASLVQDEPSEFGRTYTTLTVHTLPVPDRNYQELAGLMPGITPPVVQFNGMVDPQMSRQFATNGLPPYVNDQMSDGISVREPFTRGASHQSSSQRSGPGVAGPDHNLPRVFRLRVRSDYQRVHASRDKWSTRQRPRVFFR